MTNQANPATIGQMSAVGFKIAGTINRVISDGGMSFEQANYLVLSEERKLEKMTEKFCEEILGIKVDQWIEEKRRIEVFYKKFFNRTIDWSKFSVPVKKEGMNRLEVIFSDITEDDIFNAYANKFGEDKVWKYYDSITNSIKGQQARPAVNYAFSHVGGYELDLLEKSYDDGISENVRFMVPKEGIIATFRHRVETGKMYDVKGLTRFAALDSSGYAMRMYRSSNGQFYISRDSCVYRDPDYGLRQVDF